MYSAAWFEPGDDLLTAQNRKIDGILDLARVQPGQRVLEIGSGWGGLAIRAVQERDVHVTTLTLSEAQKELAERRIAEAGLSHRIDVLLEDYRHHAGREVGTYDAIVSVEMIEAVGERYWPDYFGAIDRMLADGGRMSLQAITMAHDRLLATRNGYTWVHKYVFPGGALPSMTAIDQVVSEHTSLRIQETRRLGPLLRADPAAVAAQLQRPAARGSRPWLRRDVRPDVELLPCLLRGRVRRRLPGRPADRPLPRLTAWC